MSMAHAQSDEPQPANDAQDYLPASTAEDNTTADLQLTELCSQCSSFKFADFFRLTAKGDDPIHSLTENMNGTIVGKTHSVSCAK